MHSNPIKQAHIVVDAREYSTSTGRYISKLLHELELLDTVNYYSVLLKPQDMSKVSFINPHFKKVECPYKEFTLQEQIGYLKQLNAFKADLIHFGKTEQPVLYRGKKITTIHDLTTLRFNNPVKNPVIFKAKQLVYGHVTKRVARTSAAILAPSEFVKRDLGMFTHIDATKITVTLEAADPITENPTPFPDLQNKEFIMYVGRPTPHKNLGRLIDAFQDLQKDHPALYLVLAGKTDANYDKHQQRVQRDGIQNVVFTGFVTDGQLRWLYEHCQAYVFPSLSEGFGLPGLEAMAHGAPVVSSDATCLPEIYGDAALYFDSKNKNDMASALAQVLENPDLRSALITKGVKRVAGFSWQRMAEQTLAVYQDVLTKT